MNYTELEDFQLLPFLEKKDSLAFEEIYNRYWKLLYTTAINILQNEAVAKDAVQDVFISLWQRNNVPNIQQLKPYLQQAVRFQVLKAIRTQKADENFYSRLAEITAEIIYENPLLVKEQEALFGSILQSLPADCRDVFTMSRERQMTYKQIAADLGISEKTVEKKMSICLKYIREALKQNKVLLISVCTFLCSHP